MYVEVGGCKRPALIWTADPSRVKLLIGRREQLIKVSKVCCSEYKVL